MLEFQAPLFRPIPSPPVHLKFQISSGTVQGSEGSPATNFHQPPRNRKVKSGEINDVAFSMVATERILGASFLAFRTQLRFVLR